MKKNLGKIILLLLVALHVELFASTYEWSAQTNKTKAYVNEAIHLKYICSFKDRGELYTIDFNPIGDFKDYDIKLLKEETHIYDGKRISSYDFLAIVHKAGHMLFKFPTVMKKTNEDSIKNTVLGRDNAYYEEFTKEKIYQKELGIEILDTNSKLVGNFEISVKKDDTKVKAYEPYHMEIIIKGNGDFDYIKPINFKIKNVKVFASEIIKKTKLTKDGYIGSWSQKFAFVSDKDFDIPALDIEYFSLNDKTKKTLHVDEVKLNVTKGYEKKELLDDVDEKFKIDYKYIYYLLFFMAGFLLSKVKFKDRSKVNSKEEEFKQKLSKCKNMDELIFLLLLTDRNKYKNIIQKIEKKEYKSLKSVILDID